MELVEKEIIVEAMHEARSKDELYRKIYHEPEGSIGVLRVKLIHSSFIFFFAKNTYYLVGVELNHIYLIFIKALRRSCI